MKHRHNNRILSRPAHHRLSLLKGLTSDLLAHGFLVTTEAKGKELRRYIEPLVTEAKKELTLARRRALLAAVRHPRDVEALRTVAAAHQQRPGGYLRLTKLPSTRHDAARIVRVEIVS